MFKTCTRFLKHRGGFIEKVILYSTGCPRCTVLKKKLEQKNIDFEVFGDTEAMVNMGMVQVPQLEVGGERLGFTDAVKWVNGLE